MPTFPFRPALPHQVFSAGFYPDADADHAVRCVLGATASGAADIGEVLWAIDAAEPDDHENWFRTWEAAGERARTLADTAASGGHQLSASWAYLRSATYFAAAVNALSGSGADDRLLPTFRSHRYGWDRFVDTTTHQVERVAIPYENSTLPGYFFTPAPDSTPRPTFVMVNGSDGALCALWSSGASGALARGYNVLMFDGPGQQSMLFERKTAFRPDWEAVLTPVLDHLLDRSGVDPERVALYGISQGGYWIARALVFEHRFAAAVADPGVVDVAASWSANIPKSLLRLFHAGKRKQFDTELGVGLKLSGKSAHTWNFRARPYGCDSYFDTLTAVREYTLGAADAARITTPLFIADPEDEQFWPGQSRRLAEMVSGPVHRCRFTAAEGANYHCQPLARALTEQRMFDWLDETLHLR
ncbi:alpha/beta hydrolase family protein [Nocardia carnea]|uniref:alpha/beta hydrolase family protein n=1 Tax=Nocardia carnea TaxID=37328 RepID=UPI0024572882|nr:prolyl oligopeptidase family serine peptidase [Nocardia carnea]